MKIRERVLAVVVAALAPSALAQTVDVPVPLQGPGKTVRITTPAGTSTLFAGQLRHTMSNASGNDAWLNGPQVTYSLSPLAPLGSGTLSYTVSTVASASFADPFGAAKADAIEQYFNNAQNLMVDPASSPDFAACVQLLIWETMYDYDPFAGPSSVSLTSGSFTAAKSNGTPLSSSFMGIFNSFVGALDALPDAGFRVSALRHEDAAEYVAVHQVPAPGAAVVAGLAGASLIRRRRRPA
ncbi:MAG: hypothetical protein ACOYN0_13935 [Phycisphaerales bacterium]